MGNRTTLKKVVLPRHEESAGIIFALVCIPCEKYTLPLLESLRYNISLISNEHALTGE
jgi:hypothetical protein